MYLGESFILSLGIFRDSVSFPSKIAFEGLPDLSPFPVTYCSHNPCIPDAKSAVFIEKSFILGKLHVGMLKYEKEVFLIKLSTDMMFSRKIRNFSKSVVFGCPKVFSDLKKKTRLNPTSHSEDTVH